jgi:hypothetical protein
MTEEPKRLAPTGGTLRELFLKSGNLCAFPNCPALMMDQQGVFIGQLCHIEAAEPGGERFNDKMSNEERRHVSNLMLMCYPHHQVTNDVAAYPVSRLREMKEEHEARFSRADRAILERLTDWTLAGAPKRASNLRRMNRVLGWDYGEGDLAQCIKELDEYFDVLSVTPIEVRRFLGAVVERMVRIDHTNAVRNGVFARTIMASDIEAAFHLSRKAVAEKADQLEHYGLGGVDFVDTDMGTKPAIAVRHLKSGWPLWFDLLTFCKGEAVPFSAFTDDLDFSRLDDPS